MFWVIVLAIVIVEVGLLTVQINVAVVLVEVWCVGVAERVVVLSIVFVAETVSVTLCVGEEFVLVAADPPSMPTTE